MKKSNLIKILPLKGKKVYVNYKPLTSDARETLNTYTKDGKATGKTISRNQIFLVYFK